jgi:hypothetical protein
MSLSRTDNYRMKAIACERRASDASDRTSKQDWAELAIEWHAMAYRAARSSAKNEARPHQLGRVGGLHG